MSAGPGAPAPLVGLLPAAGRAARLGRTPCSKEIYPLSPLAPGGGAEPATGAERLLARMAGAGVERAWVVLREGKWDVPAYLGRAAAGIPLAYVVLAESGSVVESLAAAAPFVAGCRVAVGFPDILFEPAGALAAAARRQEASGADAVLAVVPAERPDKVDLVESDEAGRVLSVRIKPGREAGAGGEREGWTWVGAVWSPAFFDYLAAWHREGRRPAGAPDREPYPGDVLQAAIEEGLGVEALRFPEGRHLDVGTPEDLRRALGEALAREPAG